MKQLGINKGLGFNMELTQPWRDLRDNDMNNFKVCPTHVILHPGTYSLRCEDLFVGLLPIPQQRSQCTEQSWDFGAVAGKILEAIEHVTHRLVPQAAN